MKYKKIILFFLVLVWMETNTLAIAKDLYRAKGFAYIYNEDDFKNKLIKRKLDNNLHQIAHYKVRSGSLIKLINPRTNDYVILKNNKRFKFPEFYKIIITEPVATQLNLNFNLPLLEVIEIKKNKSFIAKKTKIFKEEEKIHNNAPVETVEISNISKKKMNKNMKVKEDFNIIIAEFFSKDSASILKKRITKELVNFNSKKLYTKVNKTNKTTLIAGPYNSINLMKNDYILLKNFGFEELDIIINE